MALLLQMLAEHEGNNIQSNPPQTSVNVLPCVVATGEGATSGSHDDPVYVSDDAPADDSNRWVLIGGILLHQTDREILQSPSARLNDNHINTAQEILTRQFPQYHGMQHTTCQWGKGFTPSDSPFVQIVWVNGNHWICISSIGCSDGEVNLFDSLNYPLSASVQHVAALSHTKKSKLNLWQIDVQQQQNTCDYGLFAIAFATSLCYGQEPHHCNYKQFAMRQHLSCLKAGKMETFPGSIRKFKEKVLQICRLPVYCICRKPDGGSLMVECAGCTEWFHLHCIGMMENDLPESDWLCPHCQRA